jgi:hypothetical protein
MDQQQMFVQKMPGQLILKSVKNYEKKKFVLVLKVVEIYMVKLLNYADTVQQVVKQWL